MTVNILARGRTFDFDSTAPVQGVMYDEARAQAQAQMMHSAIHTFIALDVVAFGAWLAKWWYYGGFHWMYVAFYKFLPGFMTMVEHGQI